MNNSYVPKIWPTIKTRLYTALENLRGFVLKVGTTATLRSNTFSVASNVLRTMLNSFF